MTHDQSVTRLTYAGLFVVTLATLVYEILLTRIFSVTMWYHFAFVAVSVAIFGMTAGAIVVYLFPDFFSSEKTKTRLAQSSLLFGICTITSFMTHLTIPFNPGPALHSTPVVWLFSIALTYAVLAVPFILSGITVCLVLTRFTSHVSKLYAADLAGAAIGCIVLVLVLQYADGPTAVVVTASIACLGALLFSLDAGADRLKRTSLVWCAALAAISVSLAVCAQNQHPLLRPMWVKDKIDPRGLYEKWNSFSRVYVVGDPNVRSAPIGWGLSSKCPRETRTRQLHLDIDACAATVLTGFDGNLNDVDYLKYDVTNIAHYIRSDADVLVIGVGGGRDVLSALVFGQKSVLGVELNSNIVTAVNGVFGDFTGHLDRNPRVRFVTDEARSYIARTDQKFDILQVSLIDTWAATAAGAFVLSENSLYTVEAWKLFLSRLKPNGVLTFSRWYFSGSPGEVYRLTSLASEALVESGVKDPRKNIMIVLRRLPRSYVDGPDGVATILVNTSPFTTRDVSRIESVAKEMDFEMVLSPRYAADSVFARLATGKDLNSFAAGFPINIAPTTDDSPFFFNMLRLQDAFKRTWTGKNLSYNMTAVTVLGALLVVVLVLTFLCIIVPLMLTTDRTALRGSVSLFLFFVGIGLGFMLVEISQMQRLIVFLGHPTYGLTVVLFSLLISSGIGSMLTQRVTAASKPQVAVRFLILLTVLAVFGWLTPHVIGACQSMVTPARIAVSVGMIFPIGLFMGMAFPMGMKLAAMRAPGLTPWLWGVNGATSVCASVLAVVIALAWSISTAFWMGFACYVLAAAAYAATRPIKSAASSPAGNA